MKRLFCFALSTVFVLGILFPVSRTGEGKSPFIQQIKKIFHYSSGYEEKAKMEKGPFITGDVKSGFFQEIKNVFHYLPEEMEKQKLEKPEVKK